MWRKPSPARKRSSRPISRTPSRFLSKSPCLRLLSGRQADVPVRKVVPPLPQKPTAADVKPSVERPNEELTLADVNIASSFHPAPKPVVTPSTTSPVAVHAPQQVQLPPVTSSQSTAEPTPATILSLSNLRMKEGTATLPPVNESVVVSAQGVLAGQANEASSPARTTPPTSRDRVEQARVRRETQTIMAPARVRVSLAQSAGSGSGAPNGKLQRPALRRSRAMAHDSLEGSPPSSTVITAAQRMATSAPSLSETRLKMSIPKWPAFGMEEWRTPSTCTSACRKLGLAVLASAHR